MDWVSASRKVQVPLIGQSCRLAVSRDLRPARGTVTGQRSSIGDACSVKYNPTDYPHGARPPLSPRSRVAGQGGAEVHCERRAGELICRSLWA